MKSWDLGWTEVINLLRNLSLGVVGWNSSSRLWTACVYFYFGATLGMAAGAMYANWPSPSLPKLQSEEDSPIGRPISSEEGSWISSCHILGVVAGAAIGGFVIEKFGRKKTLLVAGLFLFFPWLLIIFGNNTAFIYTGRSIAGIGAGMIVMGCAIYNGEIAENDIRGKLGSTFIVLKLMGSLTVLVTGPFVSYQWLGVICATFPIIFVGTFFFMPETPYYLVKSGDMVNAEKNLRILSRKTVNDKFINGRLAEIETSVRNDMTNKTSLWEFLTNREYRKVIFIMSGVKILQQLCGLEAINSYMQPIIEMTESNISSEVSSIIFGIVQVPAAMVSSLLVDKLGRKPLLIVSALGCAVALFGEGTYFYIQNILEADVSSLTWLPTTGITLFLIMNPLGVQSLPYVLLGELFPANIKGIAVSSFTVVGSTMGFFVAKFFSPLSQAWGVHTMFWIFGSICFLGAIFVCLFLPETKGKTFSEIQMLVNNKKMDYNAKK